MRPEQRLRHRKDFAAAYRLGVSRGNRLLVVRVRPNGGTHTRWGFVTGKIIGGAVVRTRVKRRLREAARTIPVPPGVDIVVGARKPAATAEYETLRRSLVTLFSRNQSNQSHEPAAVRTKTQEQA